MEQPEGSRPEEVIYRENIYFGFWLWLLVIILVVLYGAITIGAIVKQMNSTAIGFGIIAVLLAALLANFWRLVFVITESSVTFGFGMIKKTFPLSEITSCESYTLLFGNFYGYGIRMGRDRTIAYNTRNGPGIKLVVEGYNRPYVVSVNNSGYVCKLLNSIIAGAPGEVGATGEGGDEPPDGDAPPAERSDG